MADVPNIAGVPALLTGFASDPVDASVMLVADLLSFTSWGSGPQWGIFLGGSCVVTADTVESFEFKRDATLSDYPVESGSFQTYDKVQVPYAPRVRFVSGGNPGNVASLLAQIDPLVGDYNLYDVVTPNAVYTSVNVHHYDYHRSGHTNAGMAAVDVWLEQVNVTAGSYSSSPDGGGGGDNTQQPSGTTPLNGGVVQTTQPSGTTPLPSPQ